MKKIIGLGILLILLCTGCTTSSNKILMTCKPVDESVAITVNYYSDHTESINIIELNDGEDPLETVKFYQNASPDYKYEYKVEGNKLTLTHTDKLTSTLNATKLNELKSSLESTNSYKCTIY